VELASIEVARKVLAGADREEPFAVGAQVRKDANFGEIDVADGVVPPMRLGPPAEGTLAGPE